MNHIATVEPSAPRENYSLLIMGVSNGDGYGGEVDGDGLRGQFPAPAGCRNRVLSPETCSGWRRSSESERGHQTCPRRGHRGGRAWPLSGQVAGLQLVPFWLRLRDGEIRSWVFVPCNSENICRRTFLKHKNSRKQELALRHWLIG